MQLQLSHRLSRLAEPALNYTSALSCAQVHIIKRTKDPLTPATTNRRERIRYAHVFARALLSCDHDMCYRGLHLHLHCASTRVDLNVILFLERHFICFLPVSVRPSALAVIFSCALGLRNPSAFFTCCLHRMQCLSHFLLLHHTGVFILCKWLNTKSECST